MSHIYTQIGKTTGLMSKFKNPTQCTWERVTRSADGGGGFTDSWANQGSLDVVIMPLNATEQSKADRLETNATHKMMFLYSAASTITTKDRIVFKSRYFNIVEFLDIGEATTWIKAICKEGVAI